MPSFRTSNTFSSSGTASRTSLSSATSVSTGSISTVLKSASSASTKRTAQRPKTRSNVNERIVQQYPSVNQNLLLLLPTLLVARCLANAEQILQEVDELDGEIESNHTVDCLSAWEKLTTVSIYVANDGEDSPECICSGSKKPCKTIHHAYDLATDTVGNFTKNMSIVYDEDVFMMSEPLFINKHVPNLLLMEIKSLSKTTINAVKSNVMFWIGCNSTNSNTSCLTYSIIFKDITFTNFGSDFPAAIVVFTVISLEINGCEFTKNKCSALNALETHITINNTTFFNNCGTANFKEKGFDLAVGFPYSNISNGGAIAVIFKSNSDMSVIISNCTFVNNMAAENLVFPFISHSLEDTQFPRVGGGILILYMENCSRKSVIVSNNAFTKNVAYSGGAIAMLSEGYARENSIFLENDTFEKNSAKSTSGAILFANWDYAKDNKLIIKRCRFIGNKARFAGAIKYLVNDDFYFDHIESVKPLLEISETVLCENRAETGSALHLILGQTINRFPTNPVHIINTTFCQHAVTEDEANKNIVSQFGGTILTHSIDIKFIGFNSVKKNKAGCGLYASNANIHVDGTLIFSENVATGKGGAMALADRSSLILYPGSFLKFEGNHAATQGGALAVFSVGMPELTYVYNPFCFLQYSIKGLPYSKWNTHVEFVNNSAELKGAAIFINTLSACSWSEDDPHQDVTKALKWNEKFVYKDNFVNDMFSNLYSRKRNESVVSVDIATDTNRLVLESPKQVQLSPGETVHLDLLAYDELGGLTYSVPMAEATAFLKNGSSIKSYMELPNKYFVLDPFGKTTNIPLYYEVNKRDYPKLTNRSVTHEVQFFDTYSSLVTKATLNVTVDKCHPGFKFADPGYCECNTNSTDSYVKSCKDSKVILKDGIWGKASNGELHGFYCPDNYCKCTGDKKADCVFNFKEPDDQCLDDRSGILCGKCNGCISLYDNRCIEETEEHLTNAKGGLAFIVIGVVVIAIMVVYLNPTFSTTLRGPVFYIQMLPYVFSDSSTSLGYFVRGVASVVALGGTTGLPLKGCLGHDWNMLEIIALTYVFAVAILLVLLLTYILSRCYILNLTRDSPFESFWILLIATYCFFSETSLVFFRCTEIEGKSVFFYDGTKPCYEGFHLYMAIVATVVFILFVILPPITVLLMCYGKVKAPLQVVDALTKGLRDQYRWWWAADLFRRFIYIALFVFINLRGVRQVAYIVLSNIILTAHSYCQPYRNSFANVGETFLLLSMTIIATLELADSENVGLAIAIWIIIGNYAFIVCVFFYNIFLFIRRRFRSKFPVLFKRFDDTPSRPDTPGRVENTSS